MWWPRPPHYQTIQWISPWSVWSPRLQCPPPLLLLNLAICRNLPRTCRAWCKTLCQVRLNFYFLTLTIMDTGPCSRLLGRLKKHCGTIPMASIEGIYGLKIDSLMLRRPNNNSWRSPTITTTTTSSSNLVCFRHNLSSNNHHHSSRNRRINTN